MKKVLLSILALVLCMCMLPIGALAAETENEISLTADIETSSEYTSLLSYETDILRQMQVLAQATKKDRLPTTVDFTKAVKVFALSDLDSSETIKTAKNSNSYYYRVPLLIDTGYVYSTFVISNGKVSGYDTSMTYDTTVGQVAYLFDEEIVSALLATVNEKVTDVTVLTIPAIKADFVYFTAGGKAYAIPFASRPDFWELDNGKIYEYEKIVSCAKALLNEMSDSDAFVGNQGGGGAIGSANNTFFYIAPLVILSVALVALGVFTMKRKIRKTK